MPLVDTETIDDVERYFNGSYIGCPAGPGVVDVVQVVGVLRDTGEIQVRSFTRPRQHYTIPWEQFSTQCITYVPLLGSVEVNSHVYYISQDTPRQWARGFTPNLLTVVSLSGGKNPQPHALADGVYNRSYHRVAAASHDLYSGRALGRSLHRLWSLVARPDIRTNILMYQTLCVGICTPENRLLLFPRYSNLVPIATHTLEQEVGVYTP